MKVSVIIPARSWDERLDETLASLAAQVLGDDLDLEVVVALSVPSDRPRPDGVRTVTNPTGAIPVGLNRAIAATTGEVICRVDSRCLLPPGYVRRVVESLARLDVGTVGGAALVLDRGVLGSAYAVAFNSPLLGPSRYRYSRRSGPTGSPYLGAWRREDLLALGGFDERLTRNQDNELAERVAASGKVVWYDAELVVGYFADRSLLGLVQHHSGFGRWRMRQAAMGQRGLAPRHLAVITAATLGAAASLGALASRRTRRKACAAGAVAYAGAGVVGLTTASRLRRARPDVASDPLAPVGVVVAPLLAALLDLAWAVGMVRGRIEASRAGDGRSGSADAAGGDGPVDGLEPLRPDRRPG